MNLYPKQRVSTKIGHTKEKYKIFGTIQNFHVSEVVYATLVARPEVYHSERLPSPQIVCVVLWDDGMEVSYTGEQIREMVEG